MGLIENLGRVASVYMDEKEKLQTVGDKRKRTRMGHGFWPHEVLRDAIIFASMLSVLLFYAWLIPPPLHGAADPYAQAGFVFPDWYVLFSYGYLRWGEYLPQFTVPTGPIGAIVDQPVFAWNAAWWGAALTGIPVGILALPPRKGGRARNFATRCSTSIGRRTMSSKRSSSSDSRGKVCSQRRRCSAYSECTSGVK